jgi:DNA-binding PadR family transcriptional regulator
MHDLTGFQRDLLYVTAGLERPHGLAIKHELDEYYDTEIHQSRLYPNLDTLVEKGLLYKRRRDQRTNEYGLTGRGKREINARIAWETQYEDRMAGSAPG